MRRVTTQAIVSLGTALVVMVTSAGMAAASPQTDDIRDLTNTHRSSHDSADALLCSSSLDAVAQAWTQHLVDLYNSSDNLALSHNSSLPSQAPSGWTSLGENVALNGGTASPVAKLVQQWIDSSGHHTNLANTKYTHIGVGYVLDSRGHSWGTQVFGAYTTSPDRTKATVTATVLDSSLQPRAGTAVKATTSAGSATSYVGSDGGFCVNVAPGSGTVTLSIGGETIDVLQGAAAGKTVSTYVVEPSMSGVGTPGLVTQTPTRVLDESNAQPGQVKCFAVRGVAGVPDNATGVVLNVTASNPQGPGHAVVYPDSDGNGATASPTASTVNFEKGLDVANVAFVALGSNGKICYATHASRLSRFIIDVSGYVTPEANVMLVAAERVVDTRPGGGHLGTVTGPALPGVTNTVKVVGTAGVPVGATAVIANVTVTGVSGEGHLKAWAADSAEPNTSVVNYAPGKDKANGQVIALSASGELSFKSYAASAHVIIDVVGYLTESSAIIPLTPTRIVETRTLSGVIGPVSGLLAANTPYALQVGSLVPANATAVVLNVTAAHPSARGHFQLYPDTVGNGKTAPSPASTLNYIVGRDIPNSVVVQIPPSGNVQLYSAAAGTNVVVDLVGYVVGDS